MKRFLPVVFLLLLTAITIACGGGGSSSTGAKSAQQASVFVTGEDAPLPSVLAFNVTLNSITLNNGSTDVAVLSTPQTIDFARLLGLRTLVAFNTVPAGTYGSATIELANPVISYLDLSTTPPSVATINGTLTNATITVALTKPMVVGPSGLAGLHMEFDLRQSLAVDATGQVTGSVNPQIDLRPVRSTDSEAVITDLRGGLVSVGTNSFVLQRIGGHDITIDVDSDTKYNGTNNLGTLVAPAVIEVDGRVQADGSVLASEVEVVCTDAAFLSGRIVAVNPASGPAQTVTLLVGEELPAISNIQVGFPTTINVSAVTDYDIRRFDNWFTNFLFNDASMVVGQRIAMGGTIDTGTGNFVPRRIVLRRQGVEGDLVQGSVNIVSGNQGDFQVQNNRMMGYLLGGPLTVQTGDLTLFFNINGLSGLQSGGSLKLAAGGLMLKDPTTGNPQLWARGVLVLP
jgi:Domain of unknown function (DUF5666)